MRRAGADLPIRSNEAMAFRWMSGLINVNHLYLHCFFSDFVATGYAKNRRVDFSNSSFKPTWTFGLQFDVTLNLHGFRNLSSWERYGFVEREGSASNSFSLALAMAMAASLFFRSFQ